MAQDRRRPSAASVTATPPIPYPRSSWTARTSNATVVGEPPEIHAFLGADGLAGGLDDGAVVAFHGHAHRGPFEGVTPDGVPVGLQREPVRPRVGKLRATLPCRGALGDPDLRFLAVSVLLTRKGRTVSSGVPAGSYRTSASPRTSSAATPSSPAPARVPEAPPWTPRSRASPSSRSAAASNRLPALSANTSCPTPAHRSFVVSCGLASSVALGAPTRRPSGRAAARPRPRPRPGPRTKSPPARRPGRAWRSWPPARSPRPRRAGRTKLSLHREFLGSLP